jgi:hypothetical protein
MTGPASASALSWDRFPIRKEIAMELTNIQGVPLDELRFVD